MFAQLSLELVMDQLSMSATAAQELMSFLEILVFQIVQMDSILIAEFEFLAGVTLPIMKLFWMNLL